MKALRSALDVLTRAWRLYLGFNLVYYGLVLCAMGAVLLMPDVQFALLQSLLAALGEGPLAPIRSAYTTGRVLLAIGMTFGFNLLAATFLWITLPSLIVPFSGLPLVALRALMWGLLFAPPLAVSTGQAGSGAGGWLAYLLLVGLILLEGQGYVLAALGAYLHGRAFLWPRSVGLTLPGPGYKYGLVEHARLYVWVVAVLLIAAVYEVWVTVVILPALQ